MTTYQFLSSRCREQKKRSTLNKPSRAIQYFDHFPSNFLKPYGRVHDEPDESILEKRTMTKSCKWLVRPPCAASEFAATLTEKLTCSKMKMRHSLDRRNWKASFQNLKNLFPHYRD